MFCLRLNLSENLRQQRIQVGQGTGRVVEIIKCPHLRVNGFGHKVRADCPSVGHRSKSTELYTFDNVRRQNPGTEISSVDFRKKLNMQVSLAQRSKVENELFIQRQAAQFYLINSHTE